MTRNPRRGTPVESAGGACPPRGGPRRRAVGPSREPGHGPRDRGAGGARPVGGGLRDERPLRPPFRPGPPGWWWGRRRFAIPTWSRAWSPSTGIAWWSRSTERRAGWRSAAGWSNRTPRPAELFPRWPRVEFAGSSTRRSRWTGRWRAPRSRDCRHSPPRPPTRGPGGSTRGASARSTISAAWRRLDLDALDGVIVGQALYTGRFTVAEAQAALDGAP